MVPKESGFNQSQTASGICEAFLSLRRHQFPSKVRLRNNLPNCMESINVDATIMRFFQTELFSRFLPSTYAGHVNLAASKPWRFMQKYRYGDTVEFIIFRVFRFCLKIMSYY